MSYVATGYVQSGLVPGGSELQASLDAQARAARAAIESGAAAVQTTIEEQSEQPGLPAASALRTGLTPTTYAVHAAYAGPSVAEAKALQTQINGELRKLGYAPIAVDGKLGPASCGAATVVGIVLPVACPKSTAPRHAGTAAAQSAASLSPVGPTVVPITQAGMSTGTKFAIGGAVVVVVGMIVGKLRGWF